MIRSNWFLLTLTCQQIPRFLSDLKNSPKLTCLSNSLTFFHNSGNHNFRERIEREARRRKSFEKMSFSDSPLRSSHHSPRQADPSGAISCPSGQTHWKLPSVLKHSPPRHNRGFLSHSSMSDSRRTHTSLINTQIQISANIFYLFPIRPTEILYSKFCLDLSSRWLWYICRSKFNWTLHS